MPREVFSVKIEGELKRLFTDTVKLKGLSTCYVVEGFMTAWLLGIHHASASKVDRSQVINLTLQRVVERVRRKHVEFLPEANCYEPRIGWFHVEDEVLNERGHVTICQCSECR